MAKDELLVIDRTFQLLKWFLGRLAKFPRSQRYGLGQRIETRLYDVFEALVRAKYSPMSVKARELHGVNVELESLRMLCRLAHDIGVMPHTAQEYAAREINEIGRMVGGWLRQQQKQTSSSG